MLAIYLFEKKHNIQLINVYLTYKIYNCFIFMIEIGACDAFVH